MHLKINFVILVLISSLLSACSSNIVSPIDSAQELYIQDLSSCDKRAKSALDINPQLPLIILVHGYNSPIGAFNKLSEALTLQGQQPVCFNYNDRNSLIETARTLNRSIRDVSKHLHTPQITLIGHSQGGLISRKASTLALNENISINLVTVSAPLAGIKSAKNCGNPLLRIASLGIHDLICWAISGDKWFEITDASDFIQQPGKLDNAIKSYLLIATDERNSCRVVDVNNQCIEDDFVFSLNEQALPRIHNGLVVTRVKLKAGHVEIVGNENTVPYKLIRALQDNGIINSPGKAELQHFQQPLEEKYNLAKAN
ncbi:MAG: hydrolase [Psychromonas sp.]|nr:hydrolase [Psychromonas sp.]